MGQNAEIPPPSEKSENPTNNAATGDRLFQDSYSKSTSTTEKNESSTEKEKSNSANAGDQDLLVTPLWKNNGLNPDSETGKDGQNAESKREGGGIEKDASEKGKDLDWRPSSGKLNDHDSFMDAGKKFATELPTEDRSSAFKELSQHLKSINQRMNGASVGDTVRELNQNLENNNSPYRFKSSQSSDGQHQFLSMRDTSGKLLGVQDIGITPYESGNRVGESKRNGDSKQENSGKEKEETSEKRDELKWNKSSGRLNEHDLFMDAGKKFATEMSKEDRSSAFKDLSQHLKSINQQMNGVSVGDTVRELNQNLENNNSPYRFKSSPSSDGQHQFLSMRDTSGKLLGIQDIGIKPFEPGNRSGESKRDGDSKQETPGKEKEQTSEKRDDLKWNKSSGRLNQHDLFMEAGKKFANELPPAERTNAHKELGKHLKSINETMNGASVDETVKELNQNLENNNSPYRFNSAKMANGEKFLTLRNNTSGKYLGSVELGR